MTKISVAIVGATGETGRNILEGLLEAKDQFVIDADMASNSAPCVQREGRLILKKTGNHRTFRPASVNKSAYSPLKDRGIKVVAAELTGPEEELVEVLSNVDVLIASLPVAHIKDRIRLARAAKKAGIKRFVPTAFAMIAPPKGVVDVQDIVSDILKRQGSYTMLHAT